GQDVAGAGADAGRSRHLVAGSILFGVDDHDGPSTVSRLAAGRGARGGGGGGGRAGAGGGLRRGRRALARVAGEQRQQGGASHREDARGEVSRHFDLRGTPHGRRSVTSALKSARSRSGARSGSWRASTGLDPCSI